MKRFRQFAAAVVSSLVLTATLTTTPALAIQGGEIATSNGIVVALSHGINSNRAFCSGSLLEPRIVVTAGHCVVENGAATFFPNGIYIPTPGADLNKDVKSTRARVIQRFWVNGFTNSSDSVEANDFAVLVLDKDLAKPLLTRLATQTEISSLQSSRALITHLGYGKLGLNTDNDGVPRQLTLNMQPRSIFSGFPTNSSFQTRGSSTKSICPGDSGGPVVTKIGNDWVLLGAQAGGDMSCARPYLGSDTTTIFSATYFNTIIEEAKAFALASTTPSEPQNFTAKATMDQVTLSWTTPAAEATTITSYQVEEVLETKRAYLGVYVDDAPTGGVLITNTILETPAELAGIEANDIILEVGGVPVKVVADLLAEMKKYRAGAKLVFKIKKWSGETKDLIIKVSEIGDPTGYQTKCTPNKDQLTCTFTGKPGTTKYRVFAKSSKGDGTPAELNVVVGAGSAPTRADATPEGTSLVVTWQDPEILGSVPRANINVSVIDLNTQVTLCTAVLTAYSCKIDKGVGSYNLGIRTETSLGNSLTEEIGEVEVLAAAPGQVTQFRAVKTSTGWKLVWQKPANDGGSTITGYQVKTLSGKSLCRVTAKTNTCIVKNTAVSKGTKIRVFAVNSVGTSKPATVTLS